MGAIERILLPPAPVSTGPGLPEAPRGGARSLCRRESAETLPERSGAVRAAEESEILSTRLESRAGAAPCLTAVLNAASADRLRPEASEYSISLRWERIA